MNLTFLKKGSTTTFDILFWITHPTRYLGALSKRDTLFSKYFFPSPFKTCDIYLRDDEFVNWMKVRCLISHSVTFIFLFIFWSKMSYLTILWHWLKLNIYSFLWTISSWTLKRWHFFKRFNINCNYVPNKEDCFWIYFFQINFCSVIRYFMRYFNFF